MQEVCNFCKKLRVEKTSKETQEQRRNLVGNFNRRLSRTFETDSDIHVHAVLFARVLLRLQSLHILVDVILVALTSSSSCDSAMCSLKFILATGAFEPS